MGSCGQGWSREQRQQWKSERRAMKDEWRARFNAGRAGMTGNGFLNDVLSWRPAYGWTGFNIAAMIVGFIIVFPLGLAILVWNIWSARQIRHSYAAMTGGMGAGMAGGWQGGQWSRTSRDLSRDSGNAVFEDYKRATLDRLEEERRKLVAEQEAFGAFLDDLKRAKDRTEFEQFMQERESRREGAEQRQGDKPGGAAGGSESKPG
jgi:hypothetical protein